MQSGNLQQVQKHVQAWKQASRKFLHQCPHTLSNGQDTIAYRHEVGCQSGVDNFGDFKFRLVIDNDWQGWGLNVIGNWIRSCWFQHGDMENWVYRQRLSGSHRVTEWVPGSARISYGPSNLSESFLEGCVMEELSLDIYVASNLEFQSW